MYFSPLYGNQKIGDKIDIVHKLDKIIHDYFTCKNQPVLLRDDDKNGYEQKNPLSDVLHARKKLTEIKASFTLNQAQVAASNNDVNKQWAQLKDQQLRLEQSFEQFTNFVQENENKRKRAKVKVEKEIIIQKKHAEEVYKLKEEITNLGLIEKQLEQNVNEYNLYQHYLQNAVNEGHEFSEIRGILMRHDTLTDSRKELGEQQTAALMQAQMTREEMAKGAANHSYSTMQLHTQLAKLRARRDEANAGINKWQAITSRISTFTADNVIAITQVRNACWQLYKNVCRTMKKPMSLEEHQSDEQLAAVSLHIQELQAVTDAVRKQIQKQLPNSMKLVTSSV